MEYNCPTRMCLCGKSFVVDLVSKDTSGLALRVVGEVKWVFGVQLSHRNVYVYNNGFSVLGSGGCGIMASWGNGVPETARTGR